MKLFWGKTTTVVSHDGGVPVIKRERGRGGNLRGDAILWKIDFHESGNSMVRCANRGRIPLGDEVYSVVASDLPMSFKFEMEVGDEKALCDVTVEMFVRLRPDGRGGTARGTEFSDFLKTKMPSSGVMTRNELQAILTDEQFNLARFMHSKLGVNSLAFYQANKHDAVSVDDYGNILPEWLKIKRITSLAIRRVEEHASAPKRALDSVARLGSGQERQYAGVSNADVLLAGRYRIVRELGRGGMAVVYLAVDNRWKGKEFAIKMPISDEARGMMRREADSLKELKHPNIACIRDFYDDDSNPFMVIDYVNGETLRKYLERRGGPLSPEHAKALLMPIAGAIDSAHGIRLRDGRCGIAHRDIKPENIMIEKQGGGYEKPYILDFGLARQMDAPLRSRVSLCGTYRYMPPEVLYGTIANAPEALRKWDVYSFAVTIYECLAGRPPCEVRTNEVVSVPPLPSDIPFGASVMRALSFDPALRPETCCDLFASPGDGGAVAGCDVAKEGAGGIVPTDGIVLPVKVIDDYQCMLGRCGKSDIVRRMKTLGRDVKQKGERTGWRISNASAFVELIASVPAISEDEMRAKRAADRHGEIIAWFKNHRIDREFDPAARAILQRLHDSIANTQEEDWQ